MPMRVGDPPALIVAGPTTSGKSALALALAERLNGVVINADAMQTYRELRVLTARPSPVDEARAPHALYGVRPAAEPGDVAWWRDAANHIMDKARSAGRLPILCGGTGMYLAALTQGLIDIPPPGAEAREEARRLVAELGPDGLHAKLAASDPLTAAALHPGDSQRVARAWEVWRGTGQGMASWRTQASQPVRYRFTALLLDPPRPALRDAIAQRFAAMLEHGALDEARSLAALGLPPTLPAMRAHGVPELALHLAGTIDLAEASRRATVATGQYTKRQATWFRHHVLAAPPQTHTIYARYTENEQFSQRILGETMAFIKSAG